MGWPPFLQVMNNTSQPSNSTAAFPGIMDTFLVSAGQASPLLQLFLFVYRFVGAQLGLDPSLLLTLLGCIWGLSKLFDQVYAMVDNFISSYFRCTIYVSENDQIYSTLMQFLSEQQDIATNRHLTAQTVFKSAWDEEEDQADALTTTSVGDDEDSPKYLNFASDAARCNPRYVPAMGPIKQLLADAKTAYFLDNGHKTTIYRPRIKESRRDTWSMWQQVARRPIRPMRTVILEHEEKHDVLRDINEYLHPGTPKWYASRGIPLRRGYLFHGPPGTGKTSFSFALAGVFGIDIYVISLQDPTVSEEDLAVLFTRLPRRCVVLLEDIDTAGLRRPNGDDDDGEETEHGSDEKTGEDKKTEQTAKKEKKSKSKKTKDSDSDSDTSGEDRKRRRKNRRRSGRNRENTNNRGANNILTVESISLSGLLNAIDGVASHEGRILIMTTNKPESLDEALIRPGRVDVQVGFKNATSVQATELFYRMYEFSGSKPVPMSKTRNAAPKAANGSIHSLVDSRGKETVLSTDALKTISQEFGQLIPEGMFSPAEIQGFLLKRKKSPRKALEDAAVWIEATVKQKELKSKVATVQ
ncbi:mitochondrial chaperone bcs1 [Fusarium heterosporum]|uniref:Mitochondrial chaperone bcs1 n=1 Tax=Fusarium heterosporum TaxID=42747 RepID=A0A8H5WX38_FUSHE|nr:mitochondrial chaperone bcs1 [Fusarium heterosporum]